MATNSQNLTPEQMSAYAGQLATQADMRTKESAIQSAVAARPQGTAFDPSSGTYKDPLSGLSYSGSAVNQADGTQKMQAVSGAVAPGQGLRFSNVATPATPVGFQPTGSMTGNSAIDNKINGSATASTDAMNPGTLSSATARTDAATTTAQNNTTQQTGNAAFDQLQQQFADNQAREKARTDAALAAQKATQQEETATASALEFKNGTTGTGFAADYNARLNAQHEAAQGQLRAQFNSYMAQSNQALASGQVALGKQLAAAAKEAFDESEKLKKDNIDAIKATNDIQKADSEVGGYLYSAALGGKQLTDQELTTHDAIKGYEPGTSKVLFGAAQFVAKKDYGAAADTMASVLGKTDTGGAVELGGVKYIVSGKANGIINTTEVDGATGENMAISYDPKTKTTTSTPMGTFSENWQIKEDNAGNLWRISANTGKKEVLGGSSSVSYPMIPGAVQKTNAAVFRDGSIGPTLPGHGANAGQCGAAVNYWYGKAIIPDSFGGKVQALSAYPTITGDAIQSHDTFLMKSGSTGHIGLVGDTFKDPVTGKMMFTCTESNFVPPNKGMLSNSRVMAVDDPRIAQFSRVPTPNVPQAGGDSVVSNAASGFGQFGGKSAQDNKPMTFTEIEKVNAQLPADRQLGANATRQDAAAAGYKPEAEEKPLSSTIIKASGLDITDPANLGLTPSQLKTRLAEVRAANGGQVPLSEDIKSAARSLADYSGDMNSLTSRSGADKAAIFAEAKRINPDFNESNFSAQKKTMINFAQGPISEGIKAITKAVDHMRDLKESADIVTSKRIAPWLPGSNYIGDVVAGATHTAGDLKAFNENAQAVADELTRVFRATGGSENDVKSWRENLSDTNSASENQKALQKGVDLMAGQVKGIFEQYKRGMNGAEPKMPIISPEDVKAIKDMGFDTSKLERYSYPAAPSGQMWVKQNGMPGIVPINEFDPKTQQKI